jgi:flavin reductase (DIM6/NTAB) family NADH-FMN oxidoreductase RutF
MILDKYDIDLLDKRYRATFINSLAGYRQVVLIGSQSDEGKMNLAIFNSLMHIGANPALWAVIFRPDTVQRDSLKNVLEQSFYTFNFVDAIDLEKAHQTSAKYESSVSEFEAVGYTPEYKQGFFAPFVKEAVVKIAMKFEQKIDIEINGTIMVIGSIQSIELNDSLIADDGFVSLHKANVLACSGLDAYYQPQFLTRLSYAKPDKWTNKI